MAEHHSEEVFVLFDALHEAKSKLLTVGAFLVAKAIDEGDPGRNIEAHPDYIEANNRVLEAETALNSIAISRA